jgi:hypothetical protein
MAAPIVVPFNFNPASTTIKTASYTIPSGKYALVTQSEIGYVNLGALSTSNASATKTFTDSEIFIQINGANYCTATQYFLQATIIDTNGASGTQTWTYTYNFPTYFNPRIVNCTGVFNSGSGTLSANTFFSGTASTNILNLNAIDQTFDAIRFQYSAGDFITANVTFRARIVTNTNQQGFWAKAGDVITIPSGAYLCVQEFNQIS